MLPGRTDNEIKNVWNTHLKKRLNPIQILHKSKRKIKRQDNSSNSVIKFFSTSGSESCSDFSSSTESLSNVSERDNSNASRNDESICDSGVEEIEESFWTEILSMNGFDSPQMEVDSAKNEDMNFWLRIFMEAGTLQEFPEI